MLEQNLKWSHKLWLPWRGKMIKNKTFVAFGAVLLALAASGCSSPGNLRSDYDPEANFGAYTTYNFFENAGPNKGQYESLFTQYMKKAIDIEMQKRGYTKSDNPDLLVNFNAILQEKTDIRTSPAGPSPYGYYGYRGGYYDPWGGYGYGTETHVSQYTEGTFNIDLVDARRKRLVWEAVGNGRVSEDDFKNLEERVMTGVPRYFEEFPFRAGNPNPVMDE
jgi:hypothetical protein